MWLVLPRANLIDNESYFMSHGREIAVFEIKIGLRHSQIGLNAFQLYVRRPGLSTGPRFISFCITSRLRSRHVTDIQCQYAFYFRFINREYPHSQNIHIWKTTLSKISTTLKISTFQKWHFRKSDLRICRFKDAWSADRKMTHLFVNSAGCRL